MVAASDSNKEATAPRILIVTHRGLAYDTPQVIYLAEYLGGNGASVEVMGPIWAECQLKNARIRRTPSGRWRNALLPAMGLWQAMTVSYDVVIAIDEVAAIAGLLGSLFRPKRPLVLYFLEFFDDTPISRIYHIARWFIRHFAHRAALVVDTNDFRMGLRQKAFKRSTLHAVVHNCPPFDCLDRNLPEDPIFRGSSANAIRLVYIGAINPNVYLEVLLEALARVSHEVCLFIVGSTDSEYGRYLQGLAAQRLKPNMCRFVGRVPRERLRPILAFAHVGVSLYGNGNATCLNERYCSPNKVYEYMAAGLPTITSDNLTLVELVERNGWGLCVPPEDPQALAEAISRLAGDKKLRQSMAEKALALHRMTMNFQTQVKPLHSAVFRTDQRIKGNDQAAALDHLQKHPGYTQEL
jgi:glycosyltransferase involved in cell wall biosynthesis